VLYIVRFQIPARVAEAGSRAFQSAYRDRSRVEQQKRGATQSDWSPYGYQLGINDDIMDIMQSQPCPHTALVSAILTNRP
jgi:hypothetical protein